MNFRDICRWDFFKEDVLKGKDEVDVLSESAKKSFLSFVRNQMETHTIKKEYICSTSFGIIDIKNPKIPCYDVIAEAVKKMTFSIRFWETIEDIKLLLTKEGQLFLVFNGTVKVPKL